MMMQHNCCSFPKIIDGRMNNHGEKCGLYYRTLPELIHHIEEQHIPLIESAKMAERKQLKEQFANDPDQYEKAYAAFISQPVPLSLICKLKPFPKGHKVNPIPAPKPKTLKFCHYKPKPQTHQIQTEITQLNEQPPIGFDPASRQSILSLHSKKLAHIENQSRLRQISTSSEGATPELLGGAVCQEQLSNIADDKKLRCGIDGCNKTYKNQQGLRQHMRSAHNASIDASLVPGTKLSATEEGILSRQLSPFITKSQQDLIGGGAVVSASSIRSIDKYQCQQCMKEFKGIKALANLNKHLYEAHQIIVASPSSSVHSSRYPSPSPLGAPQQIQQIYSPQQSPQRPISTGNITILPVTKGGQLQQPLFQQSAQTPFVAPTLTARHQQSTFLPHQTARPSAPIPPSTPPSSSQHQMGYSPHQQQTTTLIRAQPADQRHHHHISLVDQQGHEQQIQQQQTTANMVDNNQQPPVLQPQQQPPPPTARYRYYPQQQQAQQQQIYSPGPGTYTPYPPGHGATTTIYVTQQPANLGQQQQHFGGGVQQMEYEQQNDSYPRPYYRQQQPHYTVEPVQQQQGTGIYSHQPLQSTGRIPAPAASTIRVSTIGGAQQQPQQQYIQQGTIAPQQQHFHTVYAPAQPRSYQGGEQQAPYIAATIRTAPIQGPQQQRIYHQSQSQPPQQQQFYPQPRSHTQSQRQSPATVEAVLAAASPQQQQGGGNSPSVYSMHQQQQKGGAGAFVQQQQ